MTNTTTEFRPGQRVRGLRANGDVREGHFVGYLTSSHRAAVLLLDDGTESAVLTHTAVPA